MRSKNEVLNDILSVSGPHVTHVLLNLGRIVMNIFEHWP